MQRLAIRHREAESDGGFEVQRVDGRGAKTAPAVLKERQGNEHYAAIARGSLQRLRGATGVSLANRAACICRSRR